MPNFTCLPLRGQRWIYTNLPVSLARYELTIEHLKQGCDFTSVEVFSQQLIDPKRDWHRNEAPQITLIFISG